MDTGKGVLHWGLLGGIGEGQRGGEGGGIAWGEMPNVGEGEDVSKTHCYATILHDLHMYPET